MKIDLPANAKEMEFQGKLNTPDDVILAQVAQNIRRGLPQAQIWKPNTQTAVIVGGGPSLKDTLGDLRLAINMGGKVVALNGAYQWCIDHEIKPSAMCMLDAREFNARFVETEVPGCTYWLAAQCHPKAFDNCRDRRVIVWHALSAGDPEAELLKDYYFDRFNVQTQGTTVAIRALSLLYQHGFRKVEVFGIDSCWMGDEHHAYAQAENNGEKQYPVYIRPRDRLDKVQRFMCSGWQARQAHDFLTWVQTDHGQEMELNWHGDGLIATLIRTASELQIEADSLLDVPPDALV